MLKKNWKKLMTVGIVVTVMLTGTAGLAHLQSPTRHTVRAGDTLYMIARRYNVSIDDLVLLNGIENPNNLSIGMELIIASAPKVHVVSRGDTLYRLARQYDTDITTLVELNDVSNPNVLTVGMNLFVPGQGSSQADVAVATSNTQTAAAEATNNEAEELDKIHTVVRGDTLWDLGKQYGTTPQAIAAASGISVTNMLRIGQQLIIPSDTRTPVHAGAEAIAWSQVSRLFTVGMSARVTDVSTGLQFNIVRRGGTHHADCEPRTAADSAVMNRIWGGWSWERRAIVVEVGSYRIAGSMHSMPHGRQGITNNNFPGHFCVHFSDSRTHGSAYTNSGLPLACPQHQAGVREAIGK